MKKFIIIISVIVSTGLIHGSHPNPSQISMPQAQRGTAGNPTYKQRVETGLHNAGVNISSAAKTAWNSFLSAGTSASLSLQDTAGSLKTKYQESNLTSTLQQKTVTASRNIKDFWNKLMGNTSGKPENKFAIVNQETNGLDDTFSPLHETSSDSNELFSL